jgi:hypothetical protein
MTTGSSQTSGSSQTTSSSQTTTKSKSSTGNNSTGTNTTTSRRAAAFSLAGSVAAAKASGLRIAKVRYQMVRAKHVKRLRVLVTVRDGKRRLVRTAIVSIGGLAGAKTTLARTRLGFTNRKGQAAFVVVLKQSMLGRRLLVRVGARTPHARALTVGAVAVPKQVPKRGALQHITYA